MTITKGQVVPVEIVQIVLYWECPNCNEQNEEPFKRNFDFNQSSEFECRNCGIIIVSEGNVHWVVK